MILLTGGSGILGRELRKLLDCFAPEHEQMDITKKIPDIVKKADLIVHAAAYTDVTRAETEKELCYRTNVIGTRNLAECGLPMLYISTEYVFDGEKGNYTEEDYPNPLNFYALTKLLGEYESRKTRSVVLRCLFKPQPFEHSGACVDQFTTGDYVDVIAKEIVCAIRVFEMLPPTIHIGTSKKSTFDLARQTKNVKPIHIKEIPVKLPKDTSLNLTRWENIKREH